jgi:hypothetical protein
LEGTKKKKKRVGVPCMVPSAGIELRFELESDKSIKKKKKKKI